MSKAALRAVRMTSPLVLASASPRRATILRRAGFHFTVAPPGDIEETRVAAAAPCDATAAGLAVEKAVSASGQHPGAFALGADTVVALNGRLLGKPRDAADAKTMLERLRGQAHVVVTGVAVAGPHCVVSGTKTTIVRFRCYSDGEIDAYVRSGSPMDKAGAYGIQDRGFAPAAAYTGCYLNVVGLPLCLVLDLLWKAGALVDGQGRCPRCVPSLADACP